jgi:predicted amino acid dehydrogenase
LESALCDADLVVASTSATRPFIQPSHLKRNAIVCDIGRPLSVEPETASQRPDVCLIEGGLVALPGAPSINLFAGPAEDRAYACVAEAALLTLANAAHSVDLTDMLDVAAVAQLEALGERHGFQPIIE